MTLPPETPQQAYERIDTIRSVATTRQCLKDLDPALRREVILLGLARSRCQFSWSHFAQSFRIPESEWPPNPHH